MKKTYSNPNAEYLKLNTGDIMSKSVTAPAGPGTGSQGGGSAMEPGDI